MKINKITVIGGGTMGNGIAHVAAMSGHKVHLIDLNQQVLDHAMATIDKNLMRMVTKEKITADVHNATMGRIYPGNDLKNAAADSDLIIEAVNENLDLKIKIFKEIDLVAPEHAILASNTSSISISKIGGVIPDRAHQVIGMHFMNPVPVMKLVEVITAL